MKKLYLTALFMLVSGVLFAQNAVAPNGASPPKYALVKAGSPRMEGYRFLYIE